LVHVQVTAATHGFIHRKPSEQLCRRYMRCAPPSALLVSNTTTTVEMIQCITTLCRAGSGGKPVPVWTYSPPFPFHFPHCLSSSITPLLFCLCPLPARGSGGALWAPPVGSGAEPDRKRMCDVCNFCVQKTRFVATHAFMYGSHQKEAAVWFQAGHRSATMPYPTHTSPLPALTVCITTVQYLVHYTL